MPTVCSEVAVASEALFVVPLRPCSTQVISASQREEGCWLVRAAGQWHKPFYSYAWRETPHPLGIFLILNYVH